MNTLINFLICTADQLKREEQEKEQEKEKEKRKKIINFHKTTNQIWFLDHCLKIILIILMLMTIIMMLS